MAEKIKAVIVIPLYKNHIPHYEDVALKQCFKVLHQHDIIAVVPHGYDQDILGDMPFSGIKTFNDSYFRDIHGYNALMLSAEFYESFTEYDYMLIYQPDAFVFTDALGYWCSKGYDYIGAPWISAKTFNRPLKRLTGRLKNYLYVRYNAKYADGMPKIGKQMENRVGNGGFSLRRVKLFADYCYQYKDLIDKYLEMKHPWFNEDIFWSIELNRKTTRVKTPGLKEAVSFAFETQPELAIKINNSQLPFGCHAWDKHIDFWRPYFKTYGVEV